MQSSPDSILSSDTHPLRAAVERAATALAAAEHESDVEVASFTSDAATYSERAALIGEAAATLASARAELIGSDCPREWTLIQDGYEYDLITASSLQDALNQARANVSRSDYPDMKGTIWVTFGATCQETDESCEDTMQLDEPEPPCCDCHDYHDWQSPVELVGGVKENPGVFGHGGGALIHEACMHCGCRMVTDTWATNPTDGTDGHTTVTYDPGFYDIRSNT